VDPVGDGDSFDAGFLHQYVRGADLPTCLPRGNRAGAPEAFREAEPREKFLQERTTS
jgi:sugar/nucleoside kinase (ribokinase family)